jgi:hypothetical protein
MGWIMFWVLLLVINTASLIEGMQNNDPRWFSLAGAICCALIIGTKVQKEFDLE